MAHTGLLTRLDTAFSRDQKQKVYVQHLYVCGDASRMAKDVDNALRQAIALGGGRSAEQAAGYVGRLQTEKRYQRDIY